MTDLFDWRETYPAAPGFKRTDTSRAAAESMKPSAATLRAKCLDALRRMGSGTADEIANALGESPFSIRPRITELNKLHLIRDYGARRLNTSQRRAIVWQLA